MKKIVTFIFLFSFSFFLFSDEIEYIITNNNELCELIDINTKIKVDEADIFYSVNNKDAQINLYFKYNNKNIQLTQKNVELSKSKKLFSDSNFREYIPIWYFTALEEKDKSIIYSNQPKWETIKNQKNIDASPWEQFESSFWPEGFIINNIYFFLFRGQEFPISKIEFKNKIYKVYIHRTIDSYITNDYPYPDKYEKYINDEYFVLLFKFDGDYVDVWINSENDYIGKYALASYETCLSINQLMNGKCNYNNITWPRHADGTCDYEDVSSVKTVSTPTTNVVPNKTMTVSENLKLRSGEATSTQVLTVMQAGTKVKILELGKAETIDGINSNWVKVEVLSGAKDRDGRTIRAGTVGWCYGGYLK